MITYRGEKCDSLYISIANSRYLIQQIEDEIKSVGYHDIYRDKNINILEIIYVNETHIQVIYQINEED